MVQILVIINSFSAYTANISGLICQKYGRLLAPLCAVLSTTEKQNPRSHIQAGGVTSGFIVHYFQPKQAALAAYYRQFEQVIYH